MLHELKPVERRTLSAAFGGSMLDARRDGLHDLFIRDRYGHRRRRHRSWPRVKILQVTILAFAVCTALVGFSQNFEQMFVLRALQGLGFGGEWAVGSVLIGEMVRSKYRGRAVGMVQSFTYADSSLSRRSFVETVELIFSVLSGISVFLYTQVAINDTWMLILGFSLGVAASGIFGSLGSFLTSCFRPGSAGPDRGSRITSAGRSGRCSQRWSVTSARATGLLLRLASSPAAPIC